MEREQPESVSTKRAQFHGPRVDKTVQWLAESRESWKEKTKTSKAQLKMTTLALKRARKDRDRYGKQIKEERSEARQELRQKDVEIQELKKRVECLDREVERLKKKRWLHITESLEDTVIGTH
jgi:chromosome segregation ATPase